MQMSTTRRGFLQAVGATSVALGIGTAARSDDKPIQGFEKTAASDETSKSYQPISDRKLRVGLVGNGVCKFAPAFGFQDHPNVEIVAVSDLVPERCAEMTKTARCQKTYPSLEELVKDDKIEAVFIATDAPNHVKHVVE